ncbi:MAG: helix-turn-helix domain-containing protein [Clostridia bacterium]|nr:helix-turn-helix domain-containing protein [Clostridia bacterium]
MEKLNIREVRLSKNLSLRALANLTRISYATISAWEREGKIPSVTNAIQVCQILGVSVYDVKWGEIIDE